MKTWKFICGMFLAAGLFAACSSDDDAIGSVEVPTGEKVGEITVGLTVKTKAGDVATRGAGDVDAAGAPRGVYPFDYVYLVKANSKIPAEKFEDQRKMNITNGARLNIWFTDATYQKVAIQPASDKTIEPLEFTVSEIANGNVVKTGETFFYSSQIPGIDKKTVVMPQERDGTSVEFGDKLFISEQFVFGVDANKQLIVYQVYPVKQQVFPKDGNSLWPIDMGRFTAGINARFMFVDVDEEKEYGHAAEKVKERWDELFKNVSLSEVYTDGALLTKFPITFDLCKRSVVSTSHDGDIRLYGNEEKDTRIEKMTYFRSSGEHPIATEGLGFRSTAYPFIFPITELDALSGVQVNVCIPDLNTRMKCSIRFPENDNYAFKANTTTFLWLMMDIDEFKELCIKEGIVTADGTAVPRTRAAGMRELEVELPSSCLIVE